MLWYRDLTFGTKIVLYSTLSSAVALCLLAGSIILFDAAQLRRGAVRSLIIQADVLAINSTAALTFNDPSAAEESLRGLEAEPYIVYACIHDKNGELFAHYRRDGKREPWPRVLEEPGHRIEGNSLIMVRPIVLDGERIGTIHIKYELTAVYAHLKRQYVIAGVVMLLSLVAAFLLSAKLQGTLVRPVTELAMTAKTVSEEKDYSIRAVKYAPDELGRLTDAFNEMLGQIQGRDTALQQAREGLEVRVRERTAQLTKANHSLLDEVTERKRAEAERERLLYDMGERIKELKCMYAVAESIRERQTLQDIFQDVVRLLPAGWQYPDIACARVCFAGKEYVSEPFERTPWKLSSDIVVSGKHCGEVEVYYLEERPELTEDPFLEEERHLIDGIATSLSQAIERNRAEEELQDSKEKYRTLLENLPQKIFYKDKDSVYVSCNDHYARDLQIRPEEIVGRTDYEFYPKELAEKYRADDRRIVDSGETKEIEEKYVLDGQEFIIQTVKTPVKDENGNVIGVLGIFWDITERKQAEEKLEELHKQLLDTSRQAGMAEIASGVLHNVGNVLTSASVSVWLAAEKTRKSRVSGLAKATELMSQHADDLGTFITADEKGKQLPAYLTKLAEHLTAEQAAILEELASLQDNIEHIKSIISMQQSYAEIAGVVEPVTISDVLGDVLKMNAASFERHGIQVVRDYGEMPPPVLDKHKLLQILINMVKNAKYAMIDGGGQDKRLTLRVRPGEEDRVRIEVIDNGVGISVDNLTRIFAPGFTTKKDGHGFGLHSSALMATEMGGSLTGSSDGPGKGATFTLELPVQPAEISR